MLLTSGVSKIPGALITPMGMPMGARWANDHDVAHLQTKTVLMNLIWSESKFVLDKWTYQDN